jgi:hypothetical protein
MASSQTPALRRTHWKPSLRTVGFSSLGVLFFSLGMVTVYPDSFTGFSEYDDEGYVMIGLRSFLQGNALYDFVHSQYGPFYYLVEASLYTVLHMQVTHNAVRAIMGSFWLLSAALCSWSIFRLTRSWILTALGFTAAIKLVRLFVGSPGHPEEVCLVLLIGVLVGACYLSDGAKLWIGALLGSLIAALALTKINIGVYAALAIGLALLKATPCGYTQKALFALMAIFGLSLPFIILTPLLQQQWAQRTVALVVLAIVAAVLVAWRSETDQFVTPKLWIACTVALGVVGVLIIAPFLMRGTTFSAMLSMSVLQHRSSVKDWYVPFDVPTELIPVTSLMLAVAWTRMSASSKARGPMIVVFNVIKFMISVLWITSFLAVQWPMMYDLVVPCGWLVLVPSSSDVSRKPSFARVALCLLSVFSALYLLPVAGTQVAFSLVLTIPIVCVFLDDAGGMLVTAKRSERVIRVATIAAVFILLTFNAYWALRSAQAYRGLKPLRLAGAERIHVAGKTAADYQWIIATLKNSCDSYFSMPGIFSLYFWTNTPPPTRLLMSNWVGLLSHEQQQQIVNDLSRIQRLCIVYDPRMVEFWRRGQDLSQSPLASYIHDEFVACAERRGYSILVRRDAIQR